MMQMTTVDALSTVLRHELPDQMEQMRLDVERARMSAEDSWSGNMKIAEIMRDHLKDHALSRRRWSEMTPLWWEARDAMRRIRRVINPPSAW